jgi:hypothetical protein
LGSSLKLIELDSVWSMLSVCAPGYGCKAGKHYWRIAFNGKLFAYLPLGKGTKNRPQVFAGHVKSLARHLEIDACARRELPEIW